jgi:DNA modification methylase
MDPLILRADAAHLPLPDASVDLIVTSPPYWSLRSYTDAGEQYAGQVGAEDSPKAYIENLLNCTAEWARVLKPTGSMFVNLGDKYAAYNRNRGPSRSLSAAADPGREVVTEPGLPPGTRNKSLMGLPWRYALGAMDDLGLLLRAEVIWSKPNGLPESATDRVRRSHEQVFHFTRQARYYSSVDVLREIDSGKLPSSVWRIATPALRVPEALGVDHFAVYPVDLVRRIVLGWSPVGICMECGQGRAPVAERTAAGRQRSDAGDGGRGNRLPGYSDVARNSWREGVQRCITGYACACPDPAAPTRPSVVLDPFGGAGTTALVASVYGRTGISVDLSHDYGRLASWRVGDPNQRRKALETAKPRASA